MGVGEWTLEDESAQGKQPQGRAQRTRAGPVGKTLGIFFPQFNQYCLNPCWGVGEVMEEARPRLKSPWVLGCSAHHRAGSLAPEGGS